MVNYITGKDLIFHVKEYDVILVGTTINNSLGNGFQKDVERSFGYVSDANKETMYGDKNKYGRLLIVNGEPIFCLCYIYSTRTNPSKKPDVLNYDALERCLNMVKEEFCGKRIATTLIGASEYDGGGDITIVKKIIEKVFDNCDIDVYDYKQQDYHIRDKKMFDDIVSRRNEKLISREEYENEKKRYLWITHKGYYTPIPYEMSYSQMKDFLKKNKNERF